jgi:hypothetical protein
LGFEQIFKNALTGREWFFHGKQHQCPEANSRFQ